MSVRVQLPTALRDYTAGASEVVLEARDVQHALRLLSTQHPALRRHLYTDSGQLRGYVRIYLNDDEVGDLRTGGPPTQPGDVILIVPSIAGGSPDAANGAPESESQESESQESESQESESQESESQAELSQAELSRYARHLSLPDVGLEGQRKLRAARVLVVGAGGLGSPVTLYLAAAGVGTIGIVDYDTVDLSNLQRQVLYGTSDVGRPKVDVAAERLFHTNPHVAVEKHAVRLTQHNALDILAAYDVVIDGTDNFPTRYLTSDACVLLGRPYVYGSILRFEGQVSVFTGRTGPCYRCLFREPPPPGLVPSCAEGGVLGVMPGIIGTLQALEAIKLILGRGDTLVGRLALFDALTFRWRELKLRRNVDCPVCGDSPSITGLIDYDEFCGTGATMNEPQQSIPEITSGELKQRLDSGDELLLVDVREPFEWDISNLSQYGARLIPLGEVLERTDEIDPDSEIVIYCRSGGRSAGALRQLRARGYERVWNLKGGINAWASEVDPDMATY